MHEWLEALKKSAKTASPGAAAEELRRAETEAGVPLPGELGDLYSAFNGGEFEGDVVLFPLHAQGEQPSLLEKTRKALVGLPVSGVWRFGVKGKHRHLFTARKSALEQQGDGGPLPEWVQALGDEDWLYGTWEEEKRELRLYRSLSNMLNVLVPPVEREEFGDRTFARAIAAVEGALKELTEEGRPSEGEPVERVAETPAAAAEEEGEARELQYEYEEGPRATAVAEGEVAGREAPAHAARARALEQPAVRAADKRIKRLVGKPGTQGKAQKAQGLEQAAVVAAERRVKRLTEQAGAVKPVVKKGAAVKAAAKKVAGKLGAAVKAAAKKVTGKKAPAAKAPAKRAVGKKAPAKKAPAKRAVGKNVPVKKGAMKKGVAKKGAAKRAAGKKGSAKKTSARKGAAQRRS
jgi:hypothetical protein